LTATANLKAAETAETVQAAAAEDRAQLKQRIDQAQDAANQTCRTPSSWLSRPPIEQSQSASLAAALASRCSALFSIFALKSSLLAAVVQLQADAPGSAEQTIKTDLGRDACDAFSSLRLRRWHLHQLRRPIARRCRTAPR
jgi:hypothetical protein